MRISEVSRLSGVAATTLKYYIREGLVPEGERLGTNQTVYTDSHVQRVRLVRALIETGGLSIAAARQVLAALDTHADSLAYVFEAAQHALGVGGAANSLDASPEARQQVADLIAARGWVATDDNPGFDVAARALDGLSTIGFEPATGFLAAYTDAAAIVAHADVQALTTRDRSESVAELMVVGTVLGDSLLAGLRRLAQQHETAAMFPVAALAETEPTT